MMMSVLINQNIYLLIIKMAKIKKILHKKIQKLIKKKVQRNSQNQNQKKKKDELFYIYFISI